MCKKALPTSWVVPQVALRSPHPSLYLPKKELCVRHPFFLSILFCTTALLLLSLIHGGLIRDASGMLQRVLTMNAGMNHGGSCRGFCQDVPSIADR